MQNATRKKRCKTTKRHSRDFGHVTTKEGQVKKEVSEDRPRMKRNRGCSKEETCSSTIH